jgi:curved DNA-binding protein
MQPKDYYQLLGVPRNASEADIKKAYRKQARKFHPDMNKATTATQSMADINEANAVLSDPLKREAYDTHGTLRDAPQPQAHDHGFAPSGGWSEFFNFGEAARGPARGSDQHASIQLDLQDAYLGATKTLTLRTPATDPSRPGTTTERQVSIPRGICAGQQIRLAGHGGTGLRGGERGDLLLEVHFKPHPQWRTQGRDVYGPLLLSPWEASLGPWLVVPTPAGEAEVKVPVPWKAGRSIRLKGHGIPSTKNPGAKPPGDLYFELAVALPPANSAAEKEAYAAMGLAFASFKPRA